MTSDINTVERLPGGLRVKRSHSGPLVLRFDSGWIRRWCVHLRSPPARKKRLSSTGTFPMVIWLRSVCDLDYESSTISTNQPTYKYSVVIHKTIRINNTLYPKTTFPTEFGHENSLICFESTCYKDDKISRGIYC